MKKFLALVLMAAMLISIVPALADDEPIVITALMSGDNNPSPENLVLDEIQRRTGVKLVVDYVSGATLASSPRFPRTLRNTARTSSRKWART